MKKVISQTQSEKIIAEGIEMSRRLFQKSNVEFTAKGEKALRRVALRLVNHYFFVAQKNSSFVIIETELETFAGLVSAPNDLFGHSFCVRRILKTGEFAKRAKKLHVTKIKNFTPLSQKDALGWVAGEMAGEKFHPPKMMTAR